MNSTPSGQNAVSTFLSFGFRPFFLFAGGYAIVSVAAWLIWLALHANNAAIISPTIAVAPHLWHGHEMLFGYAGAVITGFVLTAVPNWTDTPPLSGRPLALLATTWLLGRAAIWFSALLPSLLVAIIDLSHLILVVCLMSFMLSKKPAPRNLVFIVIMLLLIFANAAVHAEWLGWRDDTASWGLALATYLFSMMIVIIGGRIVPAFTRNALIRCGCNDRLPRSFALVDRAAILSAASLPVAHLFAVSPQVFGMLAMVAAIFNALRLAFWRSWIILDQPIIWSLHLGYLFAVLGFVALGLSGAGMLGFVAAQHVLAIGAVGCMTLAVMTRASLGHTGRPLQVNRSTAICYVLIALSALIRAFAPDVLNMSYFTTMYLAGVLWIAGFGVFCISYVPILLGPAKTETNSA